VVTDLGILEPDDSGELVLTALHPGATVEQARQNTGWDLRAAPRLATTRPPEKEELRLLRDELDPQGIYLKG
jgi:glutaconate CoA-transferase, subunit B